MSVSKVLNRATNTVLTKIEPKSIENHFNATASVITEYGDLLARLGAEELAAFTVYYSQQTLAGERGSHTLSHYYFHNKLDRMVPRYVGGRHKQTGKLHNSIFDNEVTPTMFDIGSADSEVDYADKVIMLDQEEVGESFLEQGLTETSNNVFQIFRDII